jgi:myo-inositol-1(or 4)-monophosphatase
MYTKELKICQQASQEAGLFLAKQFKIWRRSQTKYKTVHESITWCDKASEKIIFKHLQKHFPHYDILSEETDFKNTKSDYLWTVDPLDGTDNFAMHNPFFAVSISLLYKKQIVLGVTYFPILNETYWAVKSQGAWKDKEKIHVSKINKLNKATTTYCHGRTLKDNKKAFRLYEYFRLKAADCSHFGSTALELAMVATGSTESLMVSGIKLWDVAAGVILVREAGGKVTNFAGQNWQVGERTILASNKALRPILLKHLKKLRLAGK